MRLVSFFFGIAFTLTALAGLIGMAGRERIQWVVDHHRWNESHWHLIVVAWLMLGLAWLYREQKKM